MHGRTNVSDSPVTTFSPDRWWGAFEATMNLRLFRWERLSSLVHVE